MEENVNILYIFCVNEEELLVLLVLMGRSQLLLMLIKQWWGEVRLDPLRFWYQTPGPEGSR